MMTQGQENDTEDQATTQVEVDPEVRQVVENIEQMLPTDSAAEKDEDKAQQAGVEMNSFVIHTTVSEYVPEVHVLDIVRFEGGAYKVQEVCKDGERTMTRLEDVLPLGTGVAHLYPRNHYDHTTSLEVQHRVVAECDDWVLKITTAASPEQMVRVFKELMQGNKIVKSIQNACKSAYHLYGDEVAQDVAFVQMQTLTRVVHAVVRRRRSPITAWLSTYAPYAMLNRSRKLSRRP